MRIGGSVMREYKFRGLNGNKTEWIYATLDDVTGKFQRNGVWRETVGQYTGLKDKNGKEIYEGDICNCREYECFGKLNGIMKKQDFTFVWLWKVEDLKKNVYTIMLMN